MSVKIYCLTHKEFEPPKDSIYVPLNVFEESGENIAEKNCYYSELTGCYWVYKNSDADILGICHYRRYLLSDSGGFYNENEIQKALCEYDIITTKVLTLDFPYEYGFSKNHKPYYLSELSKLLEESYPEVFSVYKRLVAGKHTLFGNMLICKRELFNEYHRWLFDILFRLESRITIDEPDSYHRRIFGFISEFLLYVFVEMKGLKCKHSMVGMVGEKREVKEIKEALWKYFEAGDWRGAQRFFLYEHKKRPDILMEASDIGWELHYLIEVMAIAEREADTKEGVKILSGCRNLRDLIEKMRNLNNSIRLGEGMSYNYSPEAVKVAKELIEAEKKRI